jgi:hypothetical protein
MFWIWADRLRGEVGGEGLALEIESFVGPVKLHEPIGECNLGPTSKHKFLLFFLFL